MDPTPLIAGLLGGVLSGCIVAVFQDRLRRKHEIWIRILNSYQDFTQAVHQLSRLHFEKRPELWNEAAKRALKALCDAAILDTDSRHKEAMERIVYKFMDNNLSVEERKQLADDATRIFNEYRAGHV